MKLNWYHWVSVFAVVNFILWVANHSCTEWDSGILHYQGFLPWEFSPFPLIIFVFLALVCLGAMIENTLVSNRNTR